MAQQVKELMTERPVTLAREASLTDAAKLMRDHGIGDVIVVEGDRAAGIVTDRDIVIRGVAEGNDPDATRAGDVLTGELAAVAPEDSIDRAIQLMRERAIRRLPVLESGKPVGIVSLGDLAVSEDRSSVLADISDEPPNR